jgi:cation/acetate symporter
VWAIYGGLISCVGLVFFSPVVSGSPTALFTDHDWSYFPLSNPGIISIPLGFFLGWLGTVTSREPEAADRFTELEVRAMTGSGAEQAVQH